MEQQIKVGVGVFIIKDGKVLLGRRKGEYGNNEYETPGGHLEYMETFEECAIRETKEEAGIEITDIKLLYTANMRIWKPKHYIHIEVIAKWKSGEPMVLEPEKKEGWGWYELDNIPQPLFKSEELALEALKTGQNYFDCE